RELRKERCSCGGTERGLAATGGEHGKVSAFAALHQNHEDQEQGNQYVKDVDDYDHFKMSLDKLWCGRRDLNPHAFRRHPLKMVCLPIPPLPQGSCDHS